MGQPRDEPETALEYLKKVHDTLEKIESQAAIMLATNAALLDAPGGSSRRHYAMGNNRLSNHGSANHNPASSSIT